MSEWIDVERETENKEKDNIWEPKLLENLFRVFT